MKSKPAFAACFSILLLSTIACRKDSHGETRQRVESSETITATVSSGQTYSFNVTAGSSLSIEKPPLHHRISEIFTFPDGRKVYHYAAVKGFTGTDEVTLLQTTTTTSMIVGGCYTGQSNEQRLTTLKTIAIKFTIAN